MDPIIKPNQGKSVLEQAQEAKVKEKVEKIKKLGDEITDTIKPMIFESDIEIGDFEILKTAITGILDVWFNMEINAKKISDVMSNPTKEETK